MTVMKKWHCTAMELVFPPKGHSRQIKRGSVNTEQPFGIPGDPMVSCPAQLEEYLANYFKDHRDEIGTLPGTVVQFDAN